MEKKREMGAGQLGSYGYRLKHSGPKPKGRPSFSTSLCCRSFSTSLTMLLLRCRTLTRLPWLVPRLSPSRSFLLHIPFHPPIRFLSRNTQVSVGDIPCTSSIDLSLSSHVLASATIGPRSSNEEAGTDVAAILRNLRRLGVLNHTRKASVETLETREVEAIFETLRKVGLEAHTTELIRSPSFLSLLHKIQLVLEEEFSPLDVRALLTSRAFVATSYDRLVSIINLLKTLHVTGDDAAKVLKQNPRLLVYSIENLERMFKYFDDLGIRKDAFLRIGTSRYCQVFSLKTETVQKRLAFLQKIGMSVDHINKVLYKYPQLLKLNVDASLQPTVAFLMSRGMDRETLLKHLRNHPGMFGMSVNLNLSKKFELLQQLGFTSKESCRAIGCLSNSSCQRLLDRCHFLKNQGFSDDDVRRMARQQPSILIQADDSLRESIDYLVNVQNRDLQEIVKFPACLSYSLENRVIPRFNILNQLKKGFRMSSVLPISSKVFQERYVEKQQGTKVEIQKDEC